MTLSDDEINAALQYALTTLGDKLEVELPENPSDRFISEFAEELLIGMLVAADVVDEEQVETRGLLDVELELVQEMMEVFVRASEAFRRDMLFRRNWA
jgi:hypothetical protein